MSKLRDKLDEPHHLSDAHLLRVFFLCLLALVALLAGVIYTHAQPIVIDCEVVSACSVEGHALQVGAVSLSGHTGGKRNHGAGNQDRPRADSTLPLKLAVSSYLALSVIDAGQTGMCLHANTCREKNPLLRPLQGSPSGLVAVKLAANSGVAYALWKLRKTRPKTARGLAVAVTGLQAVVVSSNMRQARRTR